MFSCAYIKSPFYLSNLKYNFLMTCQIVRPEHLILTPCNNVINKHLHNYRIDAHVQCCILWINNGWNIEYPVINNLWTIIGSFDRFGSSTKTMLPWQDTTQKKKKNFTQKYLSQMTTFLYLFLFFNMWPALVN